MLNGPICESSLQKYFSSRGLQNHCGTLLHYFFLHQFGMHLATYCQVKIKMTIKNDQVEKKKHDDDAELELIRQRALNSMIRNQQQRRLSSEDKKIIIPLNEETSSDEDEEDQLSLSSRDSHNRYVNKQLTQMQIER